MIWRALGTLLAVLVLCNIRSCVAANVQRLNAGAEFQSLLQSAKHIFLLIHISESDTSLNAFQRALDAVPAAAFDASSSIAGTFDASSSHQQAWLAQHTSITTPNEAASFWYWSGRRGRWLQRHSLDEQAVLRFVQKKVSASTTVTSLSSSSPAPSPSSASTLPPTTLAGLFTASAIFNRVHALARTVESRLASSTAPDTNAIVGDVRAWMESVAAAPHGVAFVGAAQNFLSAVESAVRKQSTSLVPESERLARLLKSQSAADMLHQPKLAQLASKRSMLRSSRETIPRVVHFIKTDGDASNFHLVAFLAVRSASHYLRPNKIKFHCTQEPTNKLWKMMRRLTPELQVVLGEPPRTMNGELLRLAAHQSDAWRLDILVNEGGIYMDWDLVTIANYDHLLDNAAVVFGAEKKVNNYNEALGVALIAARPQEPFLLRWRHEMHATFTNNCYACHSVQLARKLAIEHPHELLILDHLSFYHPGWEKEAAALLFDPLPAGVSPSSFAHSFGIHLFESHENVYKRVDKQALTENGILKVDTNFNLLMRQFIDRSESRDEL